jgi:phenylalanine-4-hydroxylase
MRTHHRSDDLQETYFVINDLDELLELAHIDLGPVYERLCDGPEYQQPDDVLSSDNVFTRGEGPYHLAVRSAQK